MDKKIASLKPKLQRMTKEFIAKCKEQGIELIITCGYRSNAEQDALYAQGRTTPGAIVTKAKGGQSLHNYAVAIDVCPLVGGKLAWNYDFTKLGKIGKAVGFEWGGEWVSFKDLPHFQWVGGYTLSDFQQNKVDWNKFN